MGSANKIIATHAHWALISQFDHNLVPLNTLDWLVDKNKKHKMAKVRERMGEFVFVFMAKNEISHS